MTTPFQLLLIEDDKALALLTCRYLTEQGFVVQHLPSIEHCSNLPVAQGFDLIICDVMLPGASGFEAFANLYQRFACPLLFLTALDSDQHQITGLELGACDYIVKPVRPAVLLARINANLRKTPRKSIAEFCLGDLTLNRLTHLLSCQGKAVKLTTKEVALLWLFMQHHGQVLSRELLFQKIVGRPYNGLDRTVDLKISRLRNKLQQLELDGLDIDTAYCQGYCFHYQPHGTQV